MILNTIDWIHNLKLKNMKTTTYYFMKNVKRHFLWIMSTLLENDNNIILWESEVWVLYLKITIILFYEKVWNDFIMSTSLYDLKVLVPLPWLTMGFHPP